MNISPNPNNRNPPTYLFENSLCEISVRKTEYASKGSGMTPPFTGTDHSPSLRRSGYLLELSVWDIAREAGLLLKAAFVATGEVELKERPLPRHETADA